MDDIYDELKMNQILESEKIFTLKRNIFEDNEDNDDKSPNKINQRSKINYSEESDIDKKDNILKINHILKEKNIYESKNVLLNDGNIPLSNNKEDSPSMKLYLYRKNSSNNKSKDILNYNQLKMDLMQNLEVKNKNQKNRKKNLSSIKSGKNDKLTSLYKEHIYFYKKKNVFLFLFIFGILCSLLNLFLSIALTLYGNVEILSIFIVLNLLLIFFYAIGIYFFEKFKTYFKNNF